MAALHHLVFLKVSIFVACGNRSQYASAYISILNFININQTVFEIWLFLAARRLAGIRGLCFVQYILLVICLVGWLVGLGSKFLDSGHEMFTQV